MRVWSIIMSFSKSKKKQLTSRHWMSQYVGASIYDWSIRAVSLLVVVLTVLVIVVLCLRHDWLWASSIFHRLSVDGEWLKGVPLRPICLGLSLLICTWVGIVVHHLTPIFCLRKQESRITWIQILFLLSIGLAIVAFVEFVNPDRDSTESTLLGALGLVLGWIFQDTIKSVVAFFFLRFNGLLKIDDWIIIPSHDIDGMVKKISLTTVTIENWDTTMSAFPTYILQTQHFQNLQSMMEGKTYGRLMQKTFVIDTGWIHPLMAKEVNEIKKHLGADNPFVVAAVTEGKQNINVFRDYVYQMLLTHPKVSHHPRLMVRWLEHRNEGMPLQLYCFVTDTDHTAFEWVQSQIIEQFIEALPWFGLQLYQSASGFDASNSNIFLAPTPTPYEKDYEDK